MLQNEKGVKIMKKKICAAVFGISLFLIIGLVGGVECGEPLSNLLWCLPLGVAMCVSAVVGRFGY
jgi:hypothetical protein